MEKQQIISIGREFGSGGHVIAESLAKQLNIPLYDSNLLEHIAEEKNLDYEAIKKLDEKPKNKLFHRTLNGHSTAPQEHLANMQFEFLKKKADSGESFVVVGRCAEYVLKDYEGLVSIFILGDKTCKRARVKKVYGVSEEEAKRMMEKEDINRKYYHNYFCKGKWGDSRNYDLCINSSRLGIEGTVEMLLTYIQARDKK